MARMEWAASGHDLRGRPLVSVASVLCGLCSDGVEGRRPGCFCSRMEKGGGNQLRSGRDPRSRSSWIRCLYSGGHLSWQEANATQSGLFLM